MPARITSPARPRGNQPSQKSTTRWSVWPLSPPSSTGGCGFWTGLGQAQIGSKLTCSPWNSRLVLRPDLLHGQHLLAQPREARLELVPWFSISSAFQPPPMPKRKRPPESTSRLATSLAVTIGVALDDEADAGAELESAWSPPPRPCSDTNGSSVCQYSLRQLGAAGRRACGGWPGCGCARGRTATRSRAPPRRGPARRCGSRSRWRRCRRRYP